MYKITCQHDSMTLVGPIMSNSGLIRPIHPYTTTYILNYESIFEASHKIACKMTHANPVIGIWCILTKMRIVHSCHNTWMSVRYNTNPRPLSCSISDTCQEPSPTINILALCNRKCQWEQLIISLTAHSNQQCPFILPIQMCTINTQYRTTTFEPFNRWLE